MNYAVIKKFDIANGAGVRESLFDTIAKTVLIKRLGILATASLLHRRFKKRF